MTTDQKIIGGIVLLTIILLFGGVLLFSSQQSTESSIPKDQIVSSNGIHWHPRLDIYIKGKRQEISANIGIGAVHQGMHTHKEDAKDGILHMEMKGVVTKDETELGNFFRIWGKEFSKDQIFEYKNGPDGKVKIFVNGKENQEFEKYRMRDKDKIEIKYE